MPSCEWVAGLAADNTTLFVSAFTEGGPLSGWSATYGVSTPFVVALDRTTGAQEWPARVVSGGEARMHALVADNGKVLVVGHTT